MSLGTLKQQQENDWSHCQRNCPGLFHTLALQKRCTYLQEPVLSERSQIAGQPAQLFTSTKIPSRSSRRSNTRSCRGAAAPSSIRMSHWAVDCVIATARIRPPALEEGNLCFASSCVAPHHCEGQRSNRRRRFQVWSQTTSKWCASFVCGSSAWQHQLAKAQRDRLHLGLGGKLDENRWHDVVGFVKPPASCQWKVCKHGSCALDVKSLEPSQETTPGTTSSGYSSFSRSLSEASSHHGPKKRSLGKHGKQPFVRPPLRRVQQHLYCLLLFFSNARVRRLHGGASPAISSTP